MRKTYNEYYVDPKSRSATPEEETPLLLRLGSASGLRLLGATYPALSLPPFSLAPLAAFLRAAGASRLVIWTALSPSLTPGASTAFCASQRAGAPLCPTLHTQAAHLCSAHPILLCTAYAGSIQSLHCSLCLATA